MVKRNNEVKDAEIEEIKEKTKKEEVEETTVIKPEVNNQNKKTNTFCLLGFIFSLTISSTLGLVFSILGLNEIKKNNEDGRGLAIAGIIISIVRVVLFIIIFVIYFIIILAFGLDSTFDGEVYFSQCDDITFDSNGNYNGYIEGSPVTCNNYTCTKEQDGTEYTFTCEN